MGRGQGEPESTNWATACRHCGYDNYGIPSQVCPECGEKFVARPHPPRRGSHDARSLIKASLVDLPGVVIVNVVLGGLGLLASRSVFAGSPRVLLFVVGLIAAGSALVGGIKLWLMFFEGERDSSLVDIERFMLGVLVALTVIHLVALLVYVAG